MTTQTTTDPQEELLTEVDKNNHVIGSIPRGLAHKSPDTIYRTIFVVVINEEGKILLQKRSSSKDLYPDCWDLSVGGHVDYGQSYEQTAVKELSEELGIEASANELKFVGEVLVKLPSSNEFFHVFEYYLKSTDNINLSTDEVASTKWMPMADVKKSIQQQKWKWYPRPVQVVEALYWSQND